MEEILARYEQTERDMVFRHPWVPFLYNWIIAVTVVALFTSFVIWGLDIRTERRAADMTATARAAWEAQLQAEADAKEEELAQIRASQDYIMAQEATAVAKAYYGIRNFIEKYNYSETDLETYARCMFNRAEGGDLVSVVSAKEQFLGYADGNTVLDDYYNIALRLVEKWHTETTKPCDISYKYAELTPEGIFLKNDINANGYARRWHA